VVGGEVGSICAWTVSPGFSQWWEESGTFVARLTPDGSSESQFGSSGVVSTHGRCKKEAGAAGESFGGLVQPSPETVLALSGHLEDSTWRFRTYSPTGVLSETQAAVEGEYPLQIVMVGYNYLVRSEDFGQSGLLNSIEVLREFTPQGVPDPGFGIDGRVPLPSMSCEFGLGCLTVLTDGRILVAGVLYRGQVGVEQYLANGSRDHSFGTEGSAWAELIRYEGEMDSVNTLLILHGQPLVVGAEGVRGKGYADSQTALTLFQADGGFSANPPLPNPGEEPFSPIPLPAPEGTSGSGPGNGGPSTGTHIGSTPNGRIGHAIQTGAITGSVYTALDAVLSPHDPSRIVSDLLKSGVYNLNFNAPSAGFLTVQWTTVSAQASQHRHTTRPIIVANGAKTFSVAGRGMVTLHLTAAGRKLLKKTPPIRVMAQVGFKPSGGSIQTRQSILTLRPAKTRH